MSDPRPDEPDAWVADLLSSTPGVPMPDDVVARLADVIAEEQRARELSGLAPMVDPQELVARRCEDQLPVDRATDRE